VSWKNALDLVFTALMTVTLALGLIAIVAGACVRLRESAERDPFVICAQQDAPCASFECARMPNSEGAWLCLSTVDGGSSE
jgi:hypothetical protein